MSHISSSEFSLFRDYICDICGIAVSQEKDYLIETRLTKLMADAGAETFGEFYDFVVSGKDRSIRQKIIDAITTNETMWFRDGTPWKVLEEICLPGLAASLGSGGKSRARIWCAAVSTGQEVYSTVMCVDEYLRKNRINGVGLSDFEFLATDISSRVVNIAKKGVYDKISMARGLSEFYKNKYFEEKGSAWHIDPKIRDAARFLPFNLQDDYSSFGHFDIIFCRYTLIYFANELKKDIIDRMRNALTDGGVLFTGNYVLYDLLSEGFDFNHFENLTYFTKKG